MPDKRKTFDEFAEDTPSPLDAASPADTDEVQPADDPSGGRPAEASEAERQRDQYYDLLLRTRAEFDNYRKRVERERQESTTAAAADLLGDLLPLLDDLERALGADDSAGGYRKGVELIHKQLLDLLAKRGVRPIEAVGAEFDPHVHQAVTYEHVDGRRDGEVVEELRRGYMLGDRLLRPAMVKVAKA
ncbi:MAG TPA: nucleotide exchange factor GrpE [Vicinamibacterales bacterium]|jgi:molecular chaperone GrpE